MFAWFSKKKISPDVLRVETKSFEFTVNNRGVISDLKYKNFPLIETIVFSDPEPDGLAIRFEEAFFGLESDNFNSMRNVVYKLSSERKRSKTTIFMNGTAMLVKNKVYLNFIITTDDKKLSIETRMRSSYKAFWGVTAFMKPASGCTARKAEEAEKNKGKRSDHPPRHEFVIEGENIKGNIKTTYGSASIGKEGEIRLSPSLDGSDREVVTSWKVMPDLRNYNTISFEADLFKGKK